MAHSRPVTSAVYPFLAVRIEVRGHWHEALALLDTGFDGELAVPAGLQPVGLGQPDDSVDWALADGSVLTAPLYFGTLEIVGLPPMPAIVTVLGAEYILGRGVIDLFRVTFDHGRQIIVEP